MTDTKTKSIYEKLMDARKELHSSSIAKTGFNSFSKYTYFELSDFLIPAMVILGENDLIPIISFTEVIATMTVYDVTCDATIVITSPMSTADLKACQPVQSLGAVETFQRRYLWVALMEIVEHDSIEENTGNPKHKAPAKPKPATDEQRAILQDYATENKISKRRGVWLDKQTNWDNMTVSQAKTIIDETKSMDESE